MNNLNGVKNLKIVIQVKFFKRENKTFQHFIFTNQKDKKHYEDNRFSIYYKLRKKFNEFSLSNYGFILEEIMENEDRIIFVFTGDAENPFASYYTTINDFVAPNASCDYCMYLNGERCKKMDKVLLKKRKSCMLFNQKEKLFTT